MSEEKTEKAISKEHAEQIWKTILTMAEMRSLTMALEKTADDLVNVRRFLDKQITQPLRPAVGAPHPMPVQPSQGNPNNLDQDRLRSACRDELLASQEQVMRLLKRCMRTLASSTLV
jgi:hypothetical protein